MAEETKLSIVAQLRAEGFTAGVRKMQRQLNGLSRQAKQVGGSLTRNLTAPIALAFGAAAKVAVDFEKAMAGVQAVSGFTKEEMTRLSDAAKELGRTTQLTASQAAGLQKELAKLGFSSADILKLQDSISSLAIAFDVELSDAAERMGNTLRIFGKEAKDAGQVADVMAVAFGTSALDSETLSEALTKVGPIAQGVGLTFEDTVAALAKLANNGVKGSVAGVALAKVLTTLAKDGGDVRKEFLELQSETIRVADGIERFGDRAGKFVPILSESGEEIAAFTENLIDSEGAADKARKVLEDTADGALKRMQSALEAAGISLGEVLLPALEKIVTVITGAVNRFTAMSAAGKTTVVVIGTIVAAIGPLLLVLGALTASISSVITTAGVLGVTVGGLLGPIALFAGALVAVGMLVFADETRKANEELKQQKILLNDIADEKNKDRFNNAKNVDELKEIISLAEAGKDSFSIIPDDTLFKLSEAGNQYADLFRNIRREQKAQGNGATEIIALLNEELTSQENLRDEKEKQAKLDAEAADLAERQARWKKEEEESAARIKKYSDDTYISEEDRLKGAIAIADNLEREMTMRENLLAITERMTNEANRAGDTLSLGGESFTFSGDEAGVDEDLAPGISKARELYTSLFASIRQEGRDTGEVLRELFNEENIVATTAAMANLFKGVFDGILNGTASVGDALKSLGKQLLAVALSTALANAIASAFSPASPDNLLTGGAAAPAKATALSAVVSSLFGSIPAFAEGGAVTSSTLALIGEKPGSRGEAIIPFEKMGQFIGQVLPEGFGANNVVVTGRISGNDIAISNSRGSGQRGRKY